MCSQTNNLQIIVPYIQNLRWSTVGELAAEADMRLEGGFHLKILKNLEQVSARPIRPSYARKAFFGCWVQILIFR